MADKEGKRSGTGHGAKTGSTKAKPGAGAQAKTGATGKSTKRAPTKSR